MNRLTFCFGYAIVAMLCLTMVAAGAHAETAFGCYAIKFGATWCGPCKVLQKKIDGSEVCVEKIPADSLPDSPAGTVCKEHAVDQEGLEMCRRLTSIDIDRLPDDQAQQLCRMYGVRLYPTTVIFRYQYDTETGEGKESVLETFTGAGPDVVAKVERILNGDSCKPASANRGSAPNKKSSSFAPSTSSLYSESDLGLPTSYSGSASSSQGYSDGYDVGAASYSSVY